MYFDFTAQFQFLRYFVFAFLLGLTMTPTLLLGDRLTDELRLLTYFSAIACLFFANWIVFASKYGAFLDGFYASLSRRTNREAEFVSEGLEPPDILGLGFLLIVVVFILAPYVVDDYVTGSTSTLLDVAFVVFGILFLALFTAISIITRIPALQGRGRYGVYVVLASPLALYPIWPILLGPSGFGVGAHKM